MNFVERVTNFKWNGAGHVAQQRPVEDRQTSQWTVMMGPMKSLPANELGLWTKQAASVQMRRNDQAKLFQNRTAMMEVLDATELLFGIFIFRGNIISWNDRIEPTQPTKSYNIHVVMCNNSLIVDLNRLLLLLDSMDKTKYRTWKRKIKDTSPQLTSDHSTVLCHQQNESH